MSCRCGYYSSVSMILDLGIIMYNTLIVYLMKFALVNIFALLMHISCNWICAKLSGCSGQGNQNPDRTGKSGRPDMLEAALLSDCH